MYYGLPGLCENGHYENSLDYAHWFKNLIGIHAIHVLFAVKLCGIVPLRHFFTDNDEATWFKCFPRYDKGTLDVKIVFLYSPLHLRLVCNWQLSTTDSAGTEMIRTGKRGSVWSWLYLFCEVKAKTYIWYSSTCYVVDDKICSDRLMFVTDFFLHQ